MPGVSGAKISAFTLTRDGTKLVVGLVGGPTPTLGVGAVVRSTNGGVVSVEPPRRVQVQGADLARIVDVAQDSATTVAVLTQPTAGIGRIFSVELDGSPGAADADPTDPLPAVATWLLASPETIERLHTIIPFDQWRFAGTLRRPSSPADDLLLYQKIAP